MFSHPQSDESADADRCLLSSAGDRNKHRLVCYFYQPFRRRCDGPVTSLLVLDLDQSCHRPILTQKDEGSLKVRVYRHVN